MRERLEEFALSLHPDKTRLIEFGRHAAADAQRRGLGKPETFNFLGFTFICGKSRRGTSCSSGRPGATACGRSSRRSRRSCDGGCTSRSPTGELAEAGRHRLLRLPRRADQQPGAAGVPLPRHRRSGDARCGGAARRTDRRGSGSRGWPTTGSPSRASFIPGRSSASPSNTRGGSRMREFRTYGSVRGALSNGRPYRD